MFFMPWYDLFKKTYCSKCRKLTPLTQYERRNPTTKRKSG
jgi:hypothetical protein